MLKFITRFGLDIEQKRNQYLPENFTRFLFDSSRKRMSTILELSKNEESEHGYPKRVHIKGASEIILSTCSHYLDLNGTKQSLDDQMSQQLKK